MKLASSLVAWSAFFVSLLCASASTHAYELRSFVTDGCTMFAEGTQREPNLWRHCCVEHDLHHWVGGSRYAHDQAHLILRDCVAATGNVRIAELMYLGVKLGEKSPIKMDDLKPPRPGEKPDPRGDTHMWGNGWPEREPHAPHTLEEYEHIETRVRDLDLDPGLKSRFLDAVYRHMP